MALPAIIGLVARSAAAGAVRASGLAAVTGRAAASAGYQGLRSGLVKAGRGFVASQKNALVNTAFESASSVLANRRAEREERLKGKDSSTPKQKRSNKEKAEGDEHENRERHERARDETLKGQGEESVSVLKVISHDTKDILAGIELLVEGSSTKRDEGNGLLGKIVSVLGGLALAFPMFSKNFIGSLGGFFTKTAAKIGTTISSILTRALSGVLGTVLKAGSGVARAAGSVGRAALGAGAAILAKGSGLTGALSRSGTAGAKAALGTTGALVAKSAGKSLLKKVPLLGAGVGLGLAGSRAYEGDWTGAGLEAASGIASILPGPGTAASLGLDAAILARDMSKSGSDSGGSGGAGSTGEISAPSSSAPAPITPVGNVGDNRPKKTMSEIYLDSINTTLRSIWGLMAVPYKGIHVKSAIDTSAPDAYANKSPVVMPDMSTITIGSSSQPQTATSSNVGTISPSSSGAISGHGGLGSLSARYESGSRGSSAVGWDSTGGTSYGKYQIASKTGTMNSFLNYLKDADPELHAQLAAAGPSDSGKNGQFAQTWKRLADSGRLGTHEHDFIKKTHFDPSLNKISSSGLREQIGNSSALQDVLWSTSVQHGAERGAGIFNKVYRDGMSEEDLIQAIYNERGTRFGSSSAKVRASVANRFKDEQKNALAMVGTRPQMSATMRESVVNNSTAQKAPVIIQQPVVAPVAPQKTPMAQASGGSSKPMYVRSPDSPIQAYSRMIIAGVA